MPIASSSPHVHVLHRLAILATAAVTLASGAIAQTADPAADDRVADKYRLKPFDRQAGIEPRRMNDHGIVVGRFAKPLQSVQPMRSTPKGQFQALPLTAPEYYGGGALAINEAGDAVGYQVRTGDHKARATLWPAAGGAIDLAASLPSHPDVRSYAWDINDHGQAVGYYQFDQYGDNAPESGHTVIWAPDGTPDVLPNPPWARGLWGTAINNHGHIAGTALPTRPAPDGAFFWSPATGLKTFGIVWSVHDMNDRDEVVGEGDVFGYGHAFYWNPTLGMRPQNLPLVKGYRHCAATAISENSLIVGHCNAASMPGNRGKRIPVAWERQPDGAWQVTELEDKFRKHFYEAYSWVSDIDAHGRLLFLTNDWRAGDVLSGIAVPATDGLSGVASDVSR